MNPSQAELTQATRALCLYHIPTEIYIWQLLTEVEAVNSSPYSYIKFLRKNEYLAVVKLCSFGIVCKGHV